MKNSEDLIFDWCKKNSHFFNEGKIRTFSIDGQNIFRSTVVLNNNGIPWLDKNSAKLAGTGRADTPKRSLYLAYCEALERLVMSLFYKEKIKPSRVMKVKFDNTGFNFNINNNIPEPPPDELITSNGWAVYFTPFKALENSVKEIVERHLISYSFLKHDWSGFYKVGESKIGDYNVNYFITKYTISNYVSCLVAIKSIRHKGFNYGYGVLEVSNIHDLKAWEHAVYEALEPLLFFDNMTSNDLQKSFRKEKDFIHARQIHSVLNSELNFSFDNPSEVNLNQCTSKEEKFAFVYEFNLNDYFDFGFEFYGCFSFSDSFIPLFSNELDGSKAKNYLKLVAQQNKVSYELFKKDIPIF